MALGCSNGQSKVSADRRPVLIKVELQLFNDTGGPLWQKTPIVSNYYRKDYRNH